MAIAKCKNCGGKLVYDEGHPTLWRHYSPKNCINGEPGIGLTEMINEYYRYPDSYSSSWSINSPGEASKYTPNAILHGLLMQATIHWNNCSNDGCKDCGRVGKTTADIYMAELTNGRHDLHPNEDSEVYIIAFRIHDAAIADGTHQKGGKPGIMTCSYVVGAGSSNACDCYNKAYARWCLEKDTKKAIITNTFSDSYDWYFVPRLD